VCVTMKQFFLVLSPLPHPLLPSSGPTARCAACAQAPASPFPCCRPSHHLLPPPSASQAAARSVHRRWRRHCCFGTRLDLQCNKVKVLTLAISSKQMSLQHTAARGCCTATLTPCRWHCSSIPRRSVCQRPTLGVSCRSCIKLRCFFSCRQSSILHSLQRCRRGTANLGGPRRTGRVRLPRPGGLSACYKQPCRHGVATALCLQQVEAHPRYLQLPVIRNAGQSLLGMLGDVLLSIGCCTQASSTYPQPLLHA
jgi:hypothetical protein